MEGYSYGPSYPDSVHSSPRSKDIDYENSLSSSWDDPMNPPSSPASSAAYPKVKFMCSYGGKILPRPHDNQLSYVGGETKIISVDRNIKFPALVSKLSSFGDYDTVLFKYQLPGEDLDALISVTNDEDLENLMQEYDRLYKSSPKPVRLRLFLFGAGPNCQPTPSSFGSEDSVATKSEKERFVEALNSVNAPPPQADPPAGNNMDFLFGLDKGGISIAPPSPPPPVTVGSQQTVVQEPRGGYPIQKNIQDLQRLSIEEHHQAMYYKKNENDVVSGGYTVHGTGDYYFPPIQDNVSQMKGPATTVSMQPGAGYWTAEKHVPGGYPGTEPLYMIQPRQGAYDHHPQMMRPVTGPPPTNQGYYTLQPGQPYPNQQIPLNLSPISTTVNPIVVAPPQIQPPVKTTAYSEGYGAAIRPPGSGGYTQVAYDNNGIGKQVYYGEGMMAAPPPAQQATQHYHQAIGVSGVSGGEIKTSNQKTVNFGGKLTHGSV